MNAKKYLKQQAHKDRQDILDADKGETLRALGVSYPSVSQKQRVLKRWLIGAASAVVSIILIVCVIVFYPTEHEIVYWDVNFESRISTASEMNSELHDFSFAIDENVFSAQISRMNDSISGDVLYYKVSLNSYDAFIKMDLVVVCNSRYSYTDFSFATTPEEKFLDSYNVVYSFQTRPDLQFGLEQLTGNAEIDGKNDTLYVITYTELLVDANPAFFDIIQKIVQPVTNK